MFAQAFRPPFCKGCRRFSKFGNTHSENSGPIRFRHRNSSAPVQGKDLQDLRNIWINDLQVQLVHFSSRGKRIMVPDSDHMIPEERPDAIVDAVQEVYAATTAN